MTNTKTARLIVLNVCWLAGVAWATAMGYTAFVFAGDKSGASFVVAAVLIAAVLATLRGKYGSLQDATMICSALGLFGTFIGLAGSLYGVDVHQMFTPDGLLDIAGRIVAGMPTALCSSIAGLVAGLWIGSNGWVVGVRAWPC